MIAAAAGGGFRIDAADLVATADAATTLAELDAALAAQRAWLALDPPGKRSQTIGAALGSGEPGPLAALFGPPRDQVIGLTFVAGGGTRVRTGGRVVKNVAGFDLAKLVVGGRGAFGVIAEAHVRLRALPEADVTRAWVGPREEIARATARLMHAGTMLAACEVTGSGLRAGSDGGTWTLMARALGTGVGVAEELDAAAAEVRSCREVFPAGDVWDGWRATVGAWPVRVRIGADPSRWSEAATIAAAHGADEVSITVPRGTVRARFTCATAATLHALRQACAAHGWPLTLEHAEAATLRAVGIWGTMADGPLRIARALRAALGPEGTQEIPLWAPS